jgi:ABC-type transporter Mla subunit MlaD
MNIKDFVIIILGLFIIFMVLTKKNNTVDNNSELIELKRKTDSLINNNKGLMETNDSLNKVFDSLGGKINNLNIKIDSSDKIIKKLKNRKGEVHNNINNLNSNELSRELTKYLERRK